MDVLSWFGYDRLVILYVYYSDLDVFFDCGFCYVKFYVRVYYLLMKEIVLMFLRFKLWRLFLDGCYNRVI